MIFYNIHRQHELDSNQIMNVWIVLCYNYAFGYFPNTGKVK